jgi:hypothetical protein
MNVNIDCLEETESFLQSPRRAILVMTTFTDILNQPEYEAVPLPEGSEMGFVSEHLEALHRCDKDVLSEILVEPIAQQIGLIG